MAVNISLSNAMGRALSHRHTHQPQDLHTLLSTVTEPPSDVGWADPQTGSSGEPGGKPLSGNGELTGEIRGHF